MTLFLQQVVNGIVAGSTYAVVALGFALIFTVMKVVNLAQPTLFMVGGFMGAAIAARLTPNVPVVMLVAAVGTGLLGIVLERLVFRPLRTANILMPLIATAGISISLQYGMELIVGPDPRPFPSLISSNTYALGGVSISSLQIFGVSVAVLIMLAMSYYVHRTPFGLATRALAEKPDVTSAFGVNVNRVAQVTVFIATAAAGIAGVAIGIRYSSLSVFVGDLYGLKSFICMIVAGTRHIEGVMAVAIFLGITEALVAGFISSNLQDAVAFVMLIVALNLRPAGLFGSYGA